MKATCPNCRAGLTAKDSYAGRAVPCPKCKFSFILPAPQQAEPTFDELQDAPQSTPSSSLDVQEEAPQQHYQQQQTDFTSHYTSPPRSQDHSTWRAWVMVLLVWIALVHAYMVAKDVIGFIAAARLARDIDRAMPPKVERVVPP